MVCFPLYLLLNLLNHSHQREDAYLKFRWTKRTTRTAILGFIVIPGAMYYLASQYNVRFFALLFLPLLTISAQI